MNSSSDAATAGAAGAFIIIFIIYGLIIVGIYAFMVWVFWRILDRAGFNGALALLNIVPFGTLILLCILAFGRWPLLDRLGIAPGAAPGYPPPASPPGTSITP